MIRVSPQLAETPKAILCQGFHRDLHKSFKGILNYSFNHLRTSGLILIEDRVLPLFILALVQQTAHLETL